ncbi:hypothetical protein PPL_04390 [Heterostelium album PN500]|uniref:Uncharacterized protein n=1 Tax=Heterostelium pallidum (strain ATCC 26659 / Pp 5 / PN500) TaxID=670386 RepID=D3B7F2_HETP5|nr:hypothetical protein PPL_04390 [Heterostelium album PN500]EFA82695.1 hypothetical protein PPL_04390 [Heterostelium album PN500]|eukprot:XP_020434812.1 hypothetical protein PPL_04390 [Heterostelium album PN500]
MPFPLVARKNLKEKEPALAKYSKEIADLVGQEWEYQFDLDGFSNYLEGKTFSCYSKEAPGTFLYSQVMEALRDALKQFLNGENPTFRKEALLDAVSAKKVIITVDTDETNKYEYYRLRFDGGVMTILFKCPVNSPNSSHFKIIESLPGAGGYPFEVALEMTRLQPRFDTYLANLSKATGQTWSLMEPAVALKLFQSFNADHQKSFAGMYLDALEKTSGNIINRVKDEMVKEAFAEKVPNATLTFVWKSTQTNCDCIYEYVNGGLVVSLRYQGFCNVSRDYDFERDL